MPHHITPQLMFEGNAEQAMRFYVSLFDDSEIVRLERYGPEEPGREGSVKQAEFTLAGRRYTCIDSHIQHLFSFTPSISLFVECVNREEFERLLEQLSEQGQILMPADDYGFSTRFAWLNDRFGVSWQLNLGTTQPGLSGETP
ncbi:VOC family protein [Billgrantia tianxiuensis]|uniref:VOC family protein n=1 Tax=Billgrantia tianxiuensis TaxID=2497861 RepID=A0A6I6SKT4_9GAMM|nr:MULTISPECIES: VOC family protein [Halomonas]MCE8033253.1 VOC family protein [Halomonas sp. MCCC 1A11057]QHC48994.1 VOC family protein [Halomonas tianxiuensis]